MKYVLVTRARGDVWDHTSPMEGQELWPEHARFMDDMVERGFLVLGGPLVDGRAVLVFDTEDEAEVESRLAADPWTASGHLHTVSSDLWTIRLDGRGR